jgi:hypothetical protein
MKLKFASVTVLLLIMFQSYSQTKIGEVYDTYGGLWASSEFSIEGSDTMYMFSIRDSQNLLELRFGAFGFFGYNNYIYFKSAIESKFGTNSTFELPMPTGTLELQFKEEILVMTWLEENKAPVISRKFTKKDCALIFKTI